MVKGYFFLGSALPPLDWEERPPISFTSLLDLYRMNLPPSALAKVKSIRELIDLQNLRQLLRKDPLDPRGNLTEKEMDQALLNKEVFPEFVFRFLERFESSESQLRHFSKLFVLFFQEKEKERDPFLRFYFHFERKLRLSLVGLRAKKLGIDLDRELQYEDVSDPLVIEIISQKEGTEFHFPTDLEPLGEKIKMVESTPMELYETVGRFRFERIKERVQDAPFSLEYILGYFILLLLVEDRWSLNVNQGRMLLNKLVKD